MIGKTIAHYKILEKLGEGGMGVVYKAEDTKLQRMVALKFLPQEWTRDPDAKARFMNEARAASALDHHNICNIHEIDETEDGQLFISMAFYEGETIREKIEGGPLKLDEAIDLAIQIADGLDIAHQKTIVHRDLKPANVLVTERGVAKIVDFGLAKLAGRTMLTKEGITLGTASYMSPEQARGEVVDHRTDIFSFGVLLYEMLTGQLPFKGDYEAAVLYSILHEDPEPVTALRSGVPMELERVVNKTLAKKTDERYQNVADIRVDLKALHNVPEKKTAVGTGPKTAPGKRYFVYGAAAILAILLILAGRQFFAGGSKTIDSIAVLPLVNLSGETDQDFFTAGMHEALISELSKISALRTISRTSVMQYKETVKTIPEIAAELDVDAVVTGSAFRSGETVRITVQLMAARPEKHLWSQTFDRDLVDVLLLHSEVARQIASEIQIKVTRDEESQLRNAVAVKTEAYENYLLGRHYLRIRLGSENLWQAMEHFERAIEIDSTFAPAHAGLAFTYYRLGGRYNIIAPEDSWPKVREYAAKALALNEGLAEAHTALALVKQGYEWDWIGAEKEYRHAMELNPNSVEVLGDYARFLAMRGRKKEAVALLQKAIKLDPNAKGRPIRVARYSGRLEEAIQLALIESESEPEETSWHFRLAKYYTEVGKYDKAIKHLQIQISLMKSDEVDEAEVDEVALLGHLYGRIGRRAQALEMLERLDELSRQGKYVSPALKAWIYAGLNDRDNAILWLTKGYEARAHRMGLGIISFKYVFEPIADDPRFKDLLRKMNLEPW